MSEDGQASSRGAPPGRLVLTLLVGATLLAGGYGLLERHLVAGRASIGTLHFSDLIRGLAASLLVGAVVAFYLMRQQAQPFATPASTVEFGLFDSESRRRQHLRWFVHVRWLAAGSTLALAVITVPLTGILPAQTFPLLLAWCAVLAAANIIFTRQLRRPADPGLQAMTQVFTDLVVLTGLLNASGGIENPLHIAYLFHVIIAGILLPKRKLAAVTAFAGCLFLLLTLGELFHLLNHYSIALFPHERLAGAGHGHAGDALGHAAHDPVFVAGRAVPFLAVLFLTAYFTNLVMERLRQSEAALERAAVTAMLEHRRLESVIDAAGVGMLVTGPDATVQWFNQRAATWLEWSDERIGKALPHLHDADGCPACLAASTAATGQSAKMERRVPGPGGGSRYFRHVTSAVRGEGGEVVQVVQLLEDTTDRKAFEAEALHAGKLSVLGQMAAGIAHEIGNPLSSLDARLHLMRRKAHDPAFIQESLQVLKSQIERIGGIVHGVSHFARHRRVDWTDFDLNALVEEAVRLVRLDRRVKAIEFDQRKVDVPRVRGVKDQILQVVLNLLLNAAEAMPRGGRLTVATERTADGAALAVSDTGAGIAEEVRAHLFEPFVTTKRDGTGLGLSISFSLIHAHGGTIQAESEPGKGARFTIRLPATSARRTDRDGFAVTAGGRDS